jgi:hypothetical protein
MLVLCCHGIEISLITPIISILSKGKKRNVFGRERSANHI